MQNDITASLDPSTVDAIIDGTIASGDLSLLDDADLELLRANGYLRLASQELSLVEPDPNGNTDVLFHTDRATGEPKIAGVHLRKEIWLPDGTTALGRDVDLSQFELGLVPTSKMDSLRRSLTGR